MLTQEGLQAQHRYLRGWQSFLPGQIRLAKAVAAVVCDTALATPHYDAHVAPTRRSRPVSPAVSSLLPMTPCIIRISRYCRSWSESSVQSRVRRRGVVWFVQPCVGVFDLKRPMKRQISLSKKLPAKRNRNTVQGIRKKLW